MSTCPAPAHAGDLLAELRGWLAASAAQCEAEHRFAEAVRLAVADDIAADTASTLSTAAHTAATAERDDCEAARLITAVLADGAVTAPELRTLRRAARLVRASARRDHTLAHLSA